MLMPPDSENLSIHLSIIPPDSLDTIIQSISGATNTFHL